MGYYITIPKVKFNIKAENKQAVIKAIKALHGQESICDSSGPHFSWVDNDFYKLNTIEELFTEFRWKPTLAENGDIIDLKFTGQKWGDDEEFFKAIAPFVESNSYIKVIGEEGAKWYWLFKDGEFKTVSRLRQKQSSIVPKQSHDAQKAKCNKKGVTLEEEECAECGMPVDVCECYDLTVEAKETKEKP